MKDFYLYPSSNPVRRVVSPVHSFLSGFAARCLLIALSVGLSATSALQAQTVPTPTQTDAIIIDNGASGKADPGDRIRYRVDVQNTGAATANGVQLNAMPDPRTTLVAGSFRTSPLAAPDAYPVTGNVPITVPAASGLLANDFDDNIGALTATAGTFATVGGGSITIAANGGFTYTPPAGFTGSDTYSYTLNDGNGVGAGVPATDVATVTFTVANLIWFVDNSAGAGDGRRNTPFNSLAAFNSGSAAAGDVVYLEQTGTDYTGGIVLAAGERLFGEGHTGGANLADVLPFTLAMHSIALPAINGSRPVITNGAGNGIALATNNAVRGVNVANTTGADILGNNFGTLTLSEVTLSGTGKALDLTTGTLAATFDAITSTSSTGQGLSLAGVAGTMTVTGGTTISGSTTQGILVGTTTANVNFGNTSVTGGTDGVSLQNNASGTRTFANLTISTSGGNGFLHGAAGGTTTVTGTTTITNPTGNGINIQSSGTAVTFAATTVDKGSTAGTAVLLGGAGTGNSGNVTFASLSITASNGAGLVGTNNTGQVVVTSATGSNITSTNAPAINMSRTGGSSTVNLNFTNITCGNSTTNGITLTNIDGTLSTVNGSITGATGTAFLVSGGTVVITHGGAFTGNSALQIDIDNHDSGNITFQTGNMVSTTQGIRVQNCGGGTIAFNNPAKGLTTGSNIAVNLSNNSGATINFNNNLALSTTTGTGFSATGGGTVNVTGTGNTITSVSATGLNISNTTIGASNVTFQSISVGNADASPDPSSGVLLNTTGSSGGLVVTGIGTTDGSGGTIRNITNRGIDATSTSNLSLKNIIFTNANLTDGAGTCIATNASGCNAPIFLNTVTNAVLDNVDITGATQQGISVYETSGFQLLNSNVFNAGSGGQNDENGLYAVNIFGTATITNTTFTQPAIRCAYVNITNKTLTLNVSNSTFHDTQTSSLGADGFEMVTNSGGNSVVTISNSTFTQNKTNGVQFLTEGTGIGEVTISGCTVDPMAGVGVGLEVASNGTSNLKYKFLNNPNIRGRGSRVVNAVAQGASTMMGRINNNTIMSYGLAGSGIRADVIGDADQIMEAIGNTISGIVGDNGITITSSPAGGVGSGRMDATISNNNVTVTSSAAYDIQILAGNSTVGFTNVTCARVNGNTVSPVPITGTMIANVQFRAATATNTLHLQGTGSSPATYWDNNSNMPTSGAGTSFGTQGLGTTTYNTQVCATPNN